MIAQGFGGILTTDSAMQRVLQIAKNIASSKATVLLSGEIGTGKKMLARFIHENSPRSNRRMVSINCAAASEQMLESELFGTETTSSGGAVSIRPGKIELANDSTLLLEEMSELPMSMQARLLQVLQDGELERVGSKQAIKVNVRIIATTNRNLKEMVVKGQFREDLYYRLNVIPLEIPPLRKRVNDVEILARHFVSVSCMINNLETKQLTDEAVARLKQYEWNGNVRELENVVERAVLLNAGKYIDTDAIDLPTLSNSRSISFGPGMTVSQAEKMLIMQTLDFTSQNRTRAAELLGISIRTLRNKLHEYNDLEVV